MSRSFFVPLNSPDRGGSVGYVYDFGASRFLWGSGSSGRRSKLRLIPNIIVIYATGLEEVQTNCGAVNYIFLRLVA